MKESQHTDWKASWRDDHLRWVCGFANAEAYLRLLGSDTPKVTDPVGNPVRDRDPVDQVSRALALRMRG